MGLDNIEIEKHLIEHEIIRLNMSLNFVPYVGATADVNLGAFDLTATEINTFSIYNSAGDLKIQPDVQGDVHLFGDTDVADDVASKFIRLWRRAAEGDTAFDLYISDTGVATMRSGLGDLMVGAHPINGSGFDTYATGGDAVGVGVLNGGDLILRGGALSGGGVAGSTLITGTVDWTGITGDINIGSNDFTTTGNGDFGTHLDVDRYLRAGKHFLHDDRGFYNGAFLRGRFYFGAITPGLAMPLIFSSGESTNTGGSMTFIVDNATRFFLDTTTADFQGTIIKTTSTGRFDAGILDNSDVLSVDPLQRVLYDTDGTSVVLDWDSYVIIDSSDRNSIEWNNRVMKDSSEATSVDWDNRRLEGGAWSIGDGATATNYMSVAADGEITLHGTARVLKHVHITPGAIRTPPSSSPGVSVVGNFEVLQFAGTGITVEQIFFDWEIPPDWASGTDITVKLHWAPTTAAAGNVKWQMDHVAVMPENNEVLTAGVTSTGITDATQTLQDELLETGTMTISGASLVVDEVMGIRIYRDPADGSDTYGADASLIEIELLYTADKLGEAT